MSLDSMKEIFDRMEAEHKPFWEIVLETDMDERQVTRQQSMAKNADHLAIHGGRGGHLHRPPPQRQRPGRRRRPENAAVFHPGPGHVRRLRQRGHRRGPVHGGVQRLHAPHCGGPHGGAACFRRCCCPCASMRS